MCMEDIRIGNTKKSVYTPLVAGTPIDFPGDARRVGIRLCVTATTASGTSARLASGAFNNPNGVPFCNVNDFMPTDEVWLERHGDLVKAPFRAVSIAGNCLIIETFMDDQQNPPRKTDIGSMNRGV